MFVICILLIMEGPATAIVEFKVEDIIKYSYIL